MRATIGVLVLALCVASGAEPPKPKFKLGKDTTFITEPLDKDGYLDYETALNEKLRGKITPETNAVVLLWQAMGPKPEGKEMPADYWKRLGVKAPPDVGEYFIGAPEYFKEQELGDFTPDRHDDLGQRPWTAKDEPHFAAWVKRNEKPLALVVEAVGRKDYYNPLVARSEQGRPGLLLTAPLGGASRTFALSDALCKRAMLRLGEGRPVDAWRDLVAAHRLGRFVGRGGSVFESLRGIGMEHRATQGYLAYLDRVRPDAATAADLLKQVRAVPPLPDPADRIDWDERLTVLDTIQTFPKKSTSPKELRALMGAEAGDPTALGVGLEKMEWDVIFRIVNSWLDRVVQAQRLPNQAGRRKAMQEIDADLRKLREGQDTLLKRAARMAKAPTTERYASEVTGERYVMLFIVGLDHSTTAYEYTRQQQLNLDLAFALAAYRADRGTYPTKLDDLTPKYLAKVPPDLFSGKPLIYKPRENGYLLYSVGENGKDDGGASRWDQPRGDDAPVRMPPTK